MPQTLFFQVLLICYAPQALATCSVRSPGHFPHLLTQPFLGEDPWYILSDQVCHKRSGSCGHFWVQRQYMRWDRSDRRSGFSSSCLNRLGNTAQRTGEVLCIPLGQEIEESPNINPSLILPLIFGGSVVPYGLLEEMSVWPSNRRGFLVEPGQL